MAFTKREKYIGMGLLGLGVLFGIDRFALTPYLEAHAQAKLAKKGRDWIAADPSEAASQVGDAIKALATGGDCNLNVSLFNIGQPLDDKFQFKKIVYTIDVEGRQEGLARLLSRIEWMPLLRVEEVRVEEAGQSRPKGELKMHLNLWLLCPPQPAPKPEPAKPAPAAAAKGSRT